MKTFLFAVTLIALAGCGKTKDAVLAKNAEAQKQATQKEIDRNTQPVSKILNPEATVQISANVLLRSQIDLTGAGPRPVSHAVYLQGGKPFYALKDLADAPYCLLGAIANEATFPLPKGTRYTLPNVLKTSPESEPVSWLLIEPNVEVESKGTWRSLYCVSRKLPNHLAITLADIKTAVGTYVEFLNAFK